MAFYLQALFIHEGSAADGSDGEAEIMWVQSRTTVKHHESRALKSHVKFGFWFMEEREIT